MISTKEIQQKVAGNEPLTGIQPTSELDLHGLRLPISDTIVELSRGHAQEIQRIVNESLGQFPHEAALVREVIGRPTVVARMDCSIGPDGVLPYECEDRPAGLGVEHLLTQRLLGRGSIEEIQEHVSQILGAEMVIVRHPDALPNDDGVALEVFESVQDLNGHVVMARGEPHMFSGDASLAGLLERSASTIITEGDKGYLTRVGAFGAKAIKAISDLPLRESSFVIKPKQGSKAKKVAVYLSPNDRSLHGDKGTVTHTRMERLATQCLVEDGEVIVQPLKPPIKVENLGNMILRVMVVVDEQNVRVTGGAYVVRPEMIVHGARNATAGLIVLEGI